MRNARSRELSVTIGIPSYMDGWNLKQMFGALSHEPIPNGSTLNEILVVTATPNDGAAEAVRWAVAHDLPARLVLENSRRGKSSAINSIRNLANGDIVLLINSDAVFVSGSLGRILEAARQNGPCIVGARPYRIPRSGFVPRLSQILWNVHHAMSAVKIPHHASGELMAVHRNIMPEIPEEIINDDAFISLKVRSQGGRIIYEPDAKVMTEPPRNVIQLFQQRRRINEGHLQLLLKYRWIPGGLLFSAMGRPLSMKRIGRSVTKPLELPLLLILGVLEAMALFNASLRTLLRKRTVSVWPKYPPAEHHVCSGE